MPAMPSPQKRGRDAEATQPATRLSTPQARLHAGALATRTFRALRWSYSPVRVMARLHYFSARVE